MQLCPKAQTNLYELKFEGKNYFIVGYFSNKEKLIISKQQQNSIFSCPKAHRNVNDLHKLALKHPRDPQWASPCTKTCM